MTSSKALLFFLLSFIGGVFISSFLRVSKLIIWEFIILGIFYFFGTVFLWKKPLHFRKTVIVFGLCLLVLGFAVWRADFVKSTEPTEAAETRTPSIAKTGSFSALKQRFQSVINQSLSPPQSSIASAILLGEKQEISQIWKEKLNMAGVRHITAISGMHIIILSQILAWLGNGIGLRRGQVFYFALVILWLFISMIGFQASAIRAGIMGSMFLFCEKIGRQKSAGRALLLTAAVMLAIDPTLLRHSVGFQLSFLATLGIIYLMPLFQRSPGLRSLRSPGLRKPADLIGMTLAAQVFTLPVLIYNFGYVSLVSPLTNLLIVPLLPYLMGLGFLLIIFGAVWLPLSLIFLFPVWLSLTYITKITDFFASLPFSAITLQIHWLWLFLAYILLAILLWQVKKRQKQHLLT